MIPTSTDVTIQIKDRIPADAEAVIVFVTEGAAPDTSSSCPDLYSLLLFSCRRARLSQPARTWRFKTRNESRRTPGR